MIRKTKHPKDRGERLARKKKIHSNASPVYLLLKEKEAQDAKGLSDQRDDDLRR